MLTFLGAINADELAANIERLSTEIGRMRESGPLSFQDVQQAANSLTRVQLVLNELERVELREHGFSSENNERFLDIENRIRVIRDELYRELQCRRPSPSIRSER